MDRRLLPSRVGLSLPVALSTKYEVIAYGSLDYITIITSSYIFVIDMLIRKCMCHTLETIRILLIDVAINEEKI